MVRSYIVWSGPTVGALPGDRQLFYNRVIYQVMAELGSLWSGPTLCGPALQRVMRGRTGQLAAVGSYIQPALLCSRPVLHCVVRLSG